MEVRLPTALDEIVGHSATMRDVGDLILKVAPTNSTVLISGESGTGKELVARSIHRYSKRGSVSFIPVNCGALPDTITEALLFGHKKGSFTGASSDERGLFEAAQGGTIFLDEIGEMPISVQVKLLRVLQEREIVRIGATRPIAIDVRVIAATNRDLTTMMMSGQFREDLYYRLTPFAVHVPPLRDRREDIALLAQHLLCKRQQEAGDGYQKEPITISDDALELLATYDWPGNVRELDNVINRLMVLANQSRIARDDVANLLGSVRNEPHGEIRLPPDELLFRNDDTITTWMRRAQHVLLTETVARYPDRTAAAKRLGLTKNALKLQLWRYRPLRRLRPTGTGSTKPQSGASY